jgi:hypothetical protein
MTVLEAPWVTSLAHSPPYNSIGYTPPRGGVGVPHSHHSSSCQQWLLPRAPLPPLWTSPECQSELALLSLEPFTISPSLYIWLQWHQACHEAPYSVPVHKSFPLLFSSLYHLANNSSFQTHLGCHGLGDTCPRAHVRITHPVLYAGAISVVHL